MSFILIPEIRRGPLSPNAAPAVGIVLLYPIRQGQFSLCFFQKEKNNRNSNSHVFFFLQ